MGIRDFFQQDVIQFRPDDQIRLRQAGVDKWMKVSALISWINQEISEMAVAMSAPHTHAQADVSGLVEALNALDAALAGKSDTGHAHDPGDIVSNFADGSGTFARRDGAYPALVKATVGSGNAVFQLTENGLAAGTPIFSIGPIKDSIMFRGEEGTNPIATGTPVWTNSDKTITVPVNRTGTAVSILGISVLAATVPANGVQMYAIVWGR